MFHGVKIPGSKETCPENEYSWYENVWMDGLKKKMLSVRNKCIHENHITHREQHIKLVRLCFFLFSFHVQ